MTSKDEWFARIEETELVELCRRLVRIKSVNPPGNELAMAEFTADFLSRAGLNVELVRHEPERASVLARLKGKGTRPGLFFSAHLDTVPVGAETWQYGPFQGEVADGKVWGRGAADMKGGMAAMLMATKVIAASRLPLQGDLILALTAGEEVDSLGAVAIAARSDLGKAQAVLVAEPSSNELFIAEKGAFWVELMTHGKTAHGSMPDLGRNAIMMMTVLLTEFNRLKIPYQKHPMLGDFSRSINTINGGVKTNVVPDQCTATVDMRTVPGQDHQEIIGRIRKMIDDLTRKIPGFSATAKIINDRPAVMTSPSDPMVKQFAGIIGRVTGREPVPQGVHYYTDAVAFVPVMKAPMLICGPGQAGLAHHPNEYVEIDKLIEAARIFTLAAVQLLGNAQGYP